ncbi:hypothetical protein BH11VER1_BH11VER1_20420 [soil metagenome]
MNLEASKPTTLIELAGYLSAECYQPHCYHIGPGWRGCGDTYCIERTPAGYEAFYVERGQRSSLIWVEDSEASACLSFIALLDGEKWSRAHCIAFTKSLSEIEQINEKLASLGIQATRNDVPTLGGPNDPRFRLFVTGRDKIAVDQMIASGQIPPVS